MEPFFTALPQQVTDRIYYYLQDPRSVRLLNKVMRSIVDQWLTNVNNKYNTLLLTERVVKPGTPIATTHRIADRLLTVLLMYAPDRFQWLTSLSPKNSSKVATLIPETVIRNARMKFIYYVINTHTPYRIEYPYCFNERYLKIWDKRKEECLKNTSHLNFGEQGYSLYPEIQLSALAEDLHWVTTLRVFSSKLLLSPEGMITLPSVADLELSKHENLDLVSQQFSLPRLKKLRLTNCSLAATSHFIVISQLTELHISNNTQPLVIDSLPPHLESLQLSHCGLTQFPDVITGNTNLKSLALDHNQITFIPASIGNCQALTYLNVSDNQLKRIPDQVFQLSQLIGLNLNRNQIVRLPDSTVGLKSLEELKVEDNQLEDLPKGLFELDTLETVDVGGNHIQIKSWPKEMFRRIREGSLTVDGRNNQVIKP